ncbi:MAG: hypothetical protein CMH47_08975 [Muricauda sp.]|nr:hypothetical protein [Allomuricauda sp.]
MSSTLYIKGCFGVIYVSQHKYPQPFLSIQKKFKSLHCLILYFNAQHSFLSFNKVLGGDDAKCKNFLEKENANFCKEFKKEKGN